MADEPVIVAADDLVPSETVQLDKSKVLAFATMYGSANSHTAILARTMNIPAVIGLGEGLAKEYDGHMAAIDGFTGTIYIDPDEETMKAMTEKREEDRRQKTLLEELKGKENVTLSGQKIKVYANIGNLSDVGAVLKNDAGGIGLFRSEFLYLESEDFRPKNSSSRYTNRLQKIWQAKRSLSVPWISEQTSRWITLDLTKKRTRHWDTGQSVSA